MSRQKPGVPLTAALCLAMGLLASGCASRQDGAAPEPRPAHAKPALASPPASLMTPQGY